MEPEEHSPLGSQFSVLSVALVLSYFFIPHKLKPIFFFFLCGLAFIVENSDSASNLSSLL